MRVKPQSGCRIQRKSASLRYVYCGPGRIQSIYSSAYSGHNIQLNVSALLLEISRQFSVRYTASLVPIAAHILQVTLCELWFRPYTRYIHFRIFRLRYSTERICATNGDISTIQCALYCKHWAQHSVDHPVYAMCTVVPVQSIYSSPYSGHNIQLHVSALLLEISRQFSVRYTACLVPNTAHISQFSLCEPWPRLFTKYLQLRIFRLQYSATGICAAIVDIASILCALYCEHGAKYSAHPPVYAMWTVVPELYNVLTIPLIQAPIFNWTYLRCHWTYIENSMRLIQQTLCQIQRISFRLRYVKCGPVHMQCNFRSTYSGFNIQMNVSTLILEIWRQFTAPCSAIFVPNTSFRYLKCGP
jgi:hypothetical protein